MSKYLVPFSYLKISPLINVHIFVIFIGSRGNQSWRCELTLRDSAGKMGFKTIVFENSSRSRERAAILAGQSQRWAWPPHSFDWQHAEPMGNRLTQRGDPFKMPPSSARAAAGDFPFPAARDAESHTSAREEQVEREQDVGREHVKWRSGQRVKHNHGRRSREAGRRRRAGARTVWTDRERLSGAGNCLQKR